MIWAVVSVRLHGHIDISSVCWRDGRIKDQYIVGKSQVSERSLRVCVARPAGAPGSSKTGIEEKLRFRPVRESRISRIPASKYFLDGRVALFWPPEHRPRCMNSPNLKPRPGAYNDSKVCPRFKPRLRGHLQRLQPSKRLGA